MDLISLRRTAAELVSAAVFELFPDVELLGGADTPTGFIYDFYFPHPIHDGLLSLIEERMRQIVREARPIRTLEMAIFSAQEFLRKEGHSNQADDLEGEEGTVELIEIGAFHSLSQGPHVKNTAELGAFKLDTIETLDGPEIRISGWIYPSKQELKQFLKKLQTYKEPQKIGEWVGLWKEIQGSLVYLEKGLALKNSLCNFFRKKMFTGALEVQGGYHEEIAKKMGILRVAEFVDDELQIHSFPREPQSEINSLLQLVEKTLIMLGFKLEFCRGPSTEVIEVEDGLGRKWAVATVTKDPKKGISVRMPIERNLLLLLERYSDPKHIMERLEQL